MNSEQLIAVKHKYKILDESIINNILDLFDISTTKQKKLQLKKKNNIFKNSKFRLDKNKISNKIILILNKVSENNLNNLYIEFLCNIEIETLEDYEIIQKEIYLKLLKDIKFIDNIIIFITNIFKIVYYNKKLLPTYFYNLLETKLNYDYIKNYKLENEFSFLKDLTTEYDRECNLIILFNLHTNSFFNKNILENISKIILDQNIKIPDIYIWFNLTKIENKHKSIIKNKLNTLKLNNRENILISSLVDNNSKNLNCYVTNILEDSSKEKEKIKTDSFLIQIENIIEEYLYLKDNSEIIEFIKTNCSNFDQKNIFCMNLIKNYFINTNINWIALFNLLIKKKIIFKSNMSKGLALYVKNNKTINKPKMKEILIFLKQNNITKNIEYLFKKYNIKINY